MFTVWDDCERIPARTSDPGTSHEAAHDAAATGLITSQQEAVLQVVKASPGLTSGEIGSRVDLGDGSRYAAARRLPELERKKLIRRGSARACSVSGRKGVTWWTY